MWLIFIRVSSLFLAPFFVSFFVIELFHLYFLLLLSFVCYLLILFIYNSFLPPPMNHLPYLNFS